MLHKILHYAKFFHYYIVAIIGMLCLLLAGHYIAIGFMLFSAIYVIGDALLGDDLSEPELSNKALLNALLYSAVPMVMMLLLINIWLVSDGSWQIMQTLSNIIGYNFVEAKTSTGFFMLALSALFSGLMLSGIATVVGHELVHRVGNKRDVCIGRWLLATSFDANFSIEHVYHHHAKVATADDPVTAPRGRNVYVHVIKAVIGTNRSSWKIESKRLQRKQQALLSWHNRYLRGCMMTAVILLGSGLLAGLQAILFVSLIGLFAKFFLEVVNYMEHYGLVRDPKQMVQPKHSWNSNKKISCWAMFNLPRHSHHHAKGAVPFEKLAPMEEAPVMISGYISTIVIALLPPLWFALMRPKLSHWDSHYANEQELAILQQQQQNQPKNKFVALFS